MSQRLFVFLGAGVGGSLGWWLGSGAGIMAAYLLGIVGTALGVYFARRAARHFLP